MKNKPDENADYYQKNPGMAVIKNFYLHSFWCQNCKHENEFWVRKGKTASEVYPSVVCLNCGCKVMTAK